MLRRLLRGIPFSRGRVPLPTTTFKRDSVLREVLVAPPDDDFKGGGGGAQLLLSVLRDSVVVAESP